MGEVRCEVKASTGKGARVVLMMAIYPCIENL